MPLLNLDRFGQIKNTPAGDSYHELFEVTDFGPGRRK